MRAYKGVSFQTGAKGVSKEAAAQYEKRVTRKQRDEAKREERIARWVAVVDKNPMEFRSCNLCGGWATRDCKHKT
jgi:hypothetical protein